MNYQREIANLPIPSNEQIECFKKHLLNAHSWYKHLDFTSGNQFVIFLEPNLDRNYTKNHVMYPWDINTKEQYFDAYGHLSYLWLDNNIWDQDGGKVRSNIPSDLMKKWSIKLFPYCHDEFEEAISLLRTALNNESIPNYEKLVELEQKITSRDNNWNSLSDDEREVLVSIDDDIDDKELATLPTSIKKYILLERETWPILTELRKLEEGKIDMTIQKLIEDVQTLKQNDY
ncbi:MAG: hypothetical protein ACRBFS_03505 [Aureispira sp.]